jgi:hypothetical protein
VGKGKAPIGVVVAGGEGGRGSSDSRQQNQYFSSAAAAASVDESTPLDAEDAQCCANTGFTWTWAAGGHDPTATYCDDGEGGPGGNGGSDAFENSDHQNLISNSDGSESDDDEEHAFVECVEAMRTESTGSSTPAAAAAAAAAGGGGSGGGGSGDSSSAALSPQDRLLSRTEKLKLFGPSHAGGSRGAASRRTCPPNNLEPTATFLGSGADDEPGGVFDLVHGAPLFSYSR